MRISGTIGVGMALALLGAFGSARAQQTPPAPQPAPGQDIVVTGRPAIAPQQARRFVRDIATPVGNQMPRFRDPVCPAVFGLAQNLDDAIARRIRGLAARSGARVASGKCVPNVVVIVASNADALVKGVRRKLPSLFAGLDTAELRRAMREGPVHVWNTTVVLNENGQAAQVSDSGGGGFAPGTPILEVQSASIIDLPTQVATVQSMIVIDAGALLGKSLMQIADYVTMRTLAAARPPSSNETPGETILTLFDPGATPPPEATLLDTSYLEGLYHSRPTERALTQMGDISRKLVKDSARDR